MIVANLWKIWTLLHVYAHNCPEVNAPWPIRDLYTEVGQKRGHLFSATCNCRSVDQTGPNLSQINVISFLRARASVLAIVILSWCLSQPGTDRSPDWDRDFWFPPYDSLESLVFCDKISCHWVKGIPTDEREKEGHPLKSVILPLLARVTWKWLQIGTDMLLKITSTGDEFF